MKEELGVEKQMLSIAKKYFVEENKRSSHPTKKVTFKEEKNENIPKDAFDMNGLQKVINTLSNEVFSLKKHVVKESSSKRPFK